MSEFFTRPSSPARTQQFLNQLITIEFREAGSGGVRAVFILPVGISYTWAFRHPLPFGLTTSYKAALRLARKLHDPNAARYGCVCPQECFSMFKQKLTATFVSGVALAFGIASVPAYAGLFTGSGNSTDPFPIAATADFEFNSGTNTLTIVLTNTGAPLSPVAPPGTNPSQASVLTELLFNGTPATTTSLPGTSGSAALTAGSSIVNPDGTTVGQNWQYIAGTGVGTTGIDFGPSGNLCVTPAGCGVMVDGSGFGLVPNGSALSTDGLSTRPYVENSATFTLVFPAGFTLSDITTVSFVYGTGSGDKTVVPGIPSGPPLLPEPASLVLLGTALAAFGVYRRRKSP
jgi:hypothetical protein